jgi:hypothetical protein
MTRSNPVSQARKRPHVAPAALPSDLISKLVKQQAHLPPIVAEGQAALRSGATPPRGWFVRANTRVRNSQRLIDCATRDGFGAVDRVVTLSRQVDVARGVLGRLSQRQQITALTRRDVRTLRDAIESALVESNGKVNPTAWGRAADDLMERCGRTLREGSLPRVERDRLKLYMGRLDDARRRVLRAESAARQTSVSPHTNPLHASKEPPRRMRATQFGPRSDTYYYNPVEDK